MSQPASAGARFRAALAAEKPLQVVGAINANHALLAQRAGYKAIYLSGGGVAAAPVACTFCRASPMRSIVSGWLRR